MLAVDAECGCWLCMLSVDAECGCWLCMLSMVAEHGYWLCMLSVDAEYEHLKSACLFLQSGQHTTGSHHIQHISLRSSTCTR